MSYCLVSFRGFEAPTWVLDAVSDGLVPGVCLFSFNVRDLEQLRALTASLHDAAQAGGHPPPLIAIDQEGGQLMAIGAATELPGNMALGATRSSGLARAAGRILGSELAALGINLNFAPVLDLATRPSNPVVGLRAFGDDPDLVARLGAALISGMQAEGVLACAKHFPGHGDTLTDSHHATASVEKSLAELLALDLRPFEAAFDAGLAAVMTAHVRYPRVEDVAATFSGVVIGDLLRSRLGFDGLLITDALDMHALGDVAPELRARRALEAGADLAVLGHLADQQEIVEDLSDSSFPEARRRVERARARLPRYEPASEARRRPLEWPRHRAEARSMAQAAITVATGGDELPLRPEADSRISLVTVSAGNLTPAETSAGGAQHLVEQVALRHGNLDVHDVTYGELDDRRVGQVVRACESADVVVLATIDAASDRGQQRLFTALFAAGHRPVVLALRSPADAAVLAGARAVICSFGRRFEQTEAAVAVLFGERTATGSMPIELAALVPEPVDETAAVRGQR